MPPLYWVSGQSMGYSEYDVTADMQAKAQQMLDDSCTVFGVGRDLKTPWPPYDKLKVVKVTRIQNMQTWQTYQAYRRVVREHRSRVQVEPFAACWQSWMEEHALQTDINELYFFHGTNASVAAKICQQGFDNRLPAASGKMLGDGCYFAENASKSDQYAVPIRGGENLFYLFIARVCVGAPYKTDGASRSLRRPPELPGSTNLYDSVLYGRPSKHREVVVYDRTACYPEYLIEYSREKTDHRA